VDLNDKACHTFGCSREDILSKDIHIRDFYGLKEEDLPQDRQEPFYANIRLKVPFGRGVQKAISYELKLQPLYDDSGKVLQGGYGTGRDVTDISNHHHQRLEGLQQLTQANKEVSRYIDNINYALKVGGMRFVIYQPDTHIMSIYSTISNVQQQLTQTHAIHLLEEGYRMQAMQMLMDMDSHKATHIDVTLKTTLKNPDGQPLYIQLLLIPSTFSQGKEYFGICRDVSEQKNTEALLEKETVKAQEVETIKNAFLHNMNYEIRTPLNSIVGFAEFFQMPHSPEDEVLFVEEIKNNAATLLALINNILFLSRIDAGMIEIKTKPTDFALAFDSMCNTYWGNNHTKEGVNFIVENHYSHMVLDIDVQNIGVILEQLIKNAKQFTEQGSIRVRYDYTGDQLIVAVEDTGSGIAPELTDHLFERFATGAKNGNGLGLSICHELTRLMNGSIKIKSAEGKGTTVWFAIPCKAKEIERKNI
jgi:light-regulated signal transduction histidine kinase (bacteriophytochrome)